MLLLLLLLSIRNSEHENYDKSIELLFADQLTDPLLLLPLSFDAEIASFVSIQVPVAVAISATVSLLPLIDP